MSNEYNPQRPANPMFRDLSNEEAEEFRQWARDNYIPGSPISSIWHPVVQQECNLINTGINPGGKVELKADPNCIACRGKGGYDLGEGWRRCYRCVPCPQCNKPHGQDQKCK
jgi:hypothetical protein